MRVGEQTGADPERVEAILERLPLEYVEMEPGDGLFFHGNLLHASDRNASEQSRWTFISCFNTRSNSPYKPSRHPDYSPLDILPDEELIQLAQQHWRELIGSS
jgi:ectoine hydroxylase-related dioxygenase (phytanoyl-CoA dioxygenase family)